MKEIGGYIELDQYQLPMLHEEAIKLNCGRNALAYILEARKINTIWLPYFLCTSIKEICEKCGVEIKFYHIDHQFLPENIELSKKEWIYLVDYYGQVSRDELLNMIEKYQNVILDFAHNYFAEPITNIDTLYTCRKYFGVSDGAILYTKQRLNRLLPQDKSFERIHYILGRYEKTASDFYLEASENNDRFSQEPIKTMSKLTNNLLHGISYDRIRQIRTENFEFLRVRFSSINRLQVQSVEGAFMYPLWIENAMEIKERLLQNKIYIPTLWPNVLEEIPMEWLEWQMAKNILPLPVDQRYTTEDMEYMVHLILKG